MNEEIFEAYRHFEDSAVGKNLTEWIQAEHDRMIDRAKKADDPQVAFGYLKEACGIMTVSQHIKSMSVKK